MAVEDLAEFDRCQGSIINSQIIQQCFLEAGGSKKRAETQTVAAILRALSEPIADNFRFRRGTIDVKRHALRLSRPIVTNADLNPFIGRQPINGAYCDGIARPKTFDNEEQ